MRLGGYRESGNVEDRRGLGGRGLAIGGGGIGVVVVAVVAMLLGVDPSSILDPASMNQPELSWAVGKAFALKLSFFMNNQCGMRMTWLLAPPTGSGFSRSATTFWGSYWMP